MNMYYGRLLNEHGISRKALGLGLEDGVQQRQKFILASKVCEVSTDASILDIGTGLGHLCDFFREHGWLGNFTGIDINLNMVEAARKRLPNDTFLCTDILCDDYSELHDHVFCISAVQHKPVYENPHIYLKKMVTKMFDLARKSLVFDVFSDRGDYYEEDNLYISPNELLDLCYRLTNKLVLRNDFKPFQIMMILFKDS